MLPFRVAPYLSLLLVLCGSALAQETEQPPTGLPPVFDIDFESTDAQLTGCPPDKVSFELVTGYVYSAPADMLDSQPGTLMLTDCIDMCRKNRSCMAVNYETGLCVLFSSNADMYPVLEEIMSWFYKIKDLFLCSLYSFYAYTRPHAHYTPTSSAMSVTGEAHTANHLRNLTYITPSPPPPPSSLPLSASLPPLSPLFLLTIRPYLSSSPILSPLLSVFTPSIPLYLSPSPPLSPLFPFFPPSRPFFPLFLIYLFPPSLLLPLPLPLIYLIISSLPLPPTPLIYLFISPSIPSLPSLSPHLPLISIPPFPPFSLPLPHLPLHPPSLPLPPPLIYLSTPPPTSLQP
ncbi:hypothetical protein C7M84_001482 [Penaeus vannamei]|uniref:Apple domain-containing protein n=1 Tax=Penaeus vannamei TaxID=6689 RepID=A0A423TTP4_PENVA|nr:hypothetical protein C7M84_001482 [Penaeus vannamei]